MQAYSPNLDTLRNQDFPLIIGQFCLLELLGEGGMGRVFLAEIRRDAGFRKQCALKVLRTDLDGPLAGRDAFINEARLGGLLNHPNIVSTLDFGDLDGRPYIAMELVDGVTVDRLLFKAGGTLPPSVALDLAIQVCEGLDHAHDLTVHGKLANLVHRDLKPSNVIVSRHGVAKVLDFGIAKAADRIGEHTRTGLTKGTPNYMSPEQIDGKTLDRRSDIFVMGSLAFAILTGQTFFQTASGGWLSVLRAISRVEEIVEEGDRLDEVEEIVPGVGAVLARCLRENPEERFARAGDLGEALQQLREALPDQTSLADFVKRVYATEADSGTHGTHPLYRLSTDTRDQRLPDHPADETPTEQDFGSPFNTGDFPTSATTRATPSSVHVQPDHTRPGIGRRAWWIAAVAGSLFAAVVVAVLLIAVVAGLSRKTYIAEADPAIEQTETIAASPEPPDPTGDGVADVMSEMEFEGQAGGAGALDLADGGPPVADATAVAADTPVTTEAEPPPRAETVPAELPPLAIEAADTPGRASAGFARSFQVRVSGSDDAQVSLVLRAEGGDWQLHRMIPAGDGTWSASVSITADMVGSAQYYFHAQHPGDAASRVQLGSPNAPFSLQVW